MRTWVTYGVFPSHTARILLTSVSPALSKYSLKQFVRLPLGPSLSPAPSPGYSGVYLDPVFIIVGPWLYLSFHLPVRSFVLAPTPSPNSPLARRRGHHHHRARPHVAAPSPSKGPGLGLIF